jgi:hypothetical protein
MTEETKAEVQTWAYLRTYYYPRFVEGITKLDWDLRYKILAEIHGNWESRPPDPVRAMMEYVKEHGYFKFFVIGATVQKDGYFKLHRLISSNLGRVGIFEE